MILAPYCLVCSQRVALEAAQQVTNDETALKTVLLKMMDTIKGVVSQDVDSFLLGLRMMEIIDEVTGSGDPYKDFKRRSTRVAEQLVSTVRETVAKSPQPLWEACRAAVMGNLMDVIAASAPELFNMSSFLEKPFAVNHFDAFRLILHRAEKVVFLADNAGEVFFDRVLIDRLLAEKGDLRIDYFIKGFPFLNDALHEDAVLALIDQVAAIRTVPLIKPIVMNQEYLHRMYAGFLDAARSADLVVVKGQANYELFMSVLKGAFYLFVHKCPVIARKEGADMGDAVFCRK
jgi:uncharacterized protein with ATP-grasp and redox domains